LIFPHKQAKSRIREILKKDVLFRHLDEKGMEVLTEAMEERRFNKDDIIVKEGTFIFFTSISIRQYLS